MCESWNALCMTIWMHKIHCTFYQTFPDILHFQGILSFNKICNRQFKSHRHSYLKHPFPWPWQMQSCLVKAFENAVLMIIFPARCFDLDIPSLSAQLPPHLPLKQKWFHFQDHSWLSSTYFLFIITTSTSTSDWTVVLTFMLLAAFSSKTILVLVFKWPLMVGRDILAVTVTYQFSSESLLQLLFFFFQKMLQNALMLMLSNTLFVCLQCLHLSLLSCLVHVLLVFWAGPILGGFSRKALKHGQNIWVLQ